jgi:hypothetical protein
MNKKRDKKPPTRWIEAADLMQGGPFTLTVKSVSAPNTEKDSDGALMEEPVIWFEEVPKGLVLGCKTNKRNVNAQLSTKAASWVGKKLTICARYLANAFGEKNVPAIRVLMPPGIPLPWQSRGQMGKETPFIESEV